MTIQPTQDRTAELRGLLGAEGPAAFKAFFSVDPGNPIEVDYVNAHLEDLRADYPEHIELVRRSVLLALPQEWSGKLLNGLPDRLLHKFATDCAERALLSEQEHRWENDPRSWGAIESKRAWLRKEISDEALEGAWEAAFDAQLDAFRSVSGVARGGCTSTAMIAARDAAQYAALNIAGYAASHAARCAATAAAFFAPGYADAVRANERDWQIRRLSELCRLFATGELA